MSNEKPTMGVIPEKIWLEMRCKDLSFAIASRLENQANARQDCVGEWTEELQRHLATIRSME